MFLPSSEQIIPPAFSPIPFSYLEVQEVLKDRELQ